MSVRRYISAVCDGDVFVIYSASISVPTGCKALSARLAQMWLVPAHKSAMHTVGRQVNCTACCIDYPAILQLNCWHK